MAFMAKRQGLPLSAVQGAAVAAAFPQTFPRTRSLSAFAAAAAATTSPRAGSRGYERFLSWLRCGGGSSSSAHAHVFTAWRRAAAPKDAQGKCVCGGAGPSRLVGSSIARRSVRLPSHRLLARKPEAAGIRLSRSAPVAPRPAYPLAARPRARTRRCSAPLSFRP
jgi:hypothetical protein